MSPKRSIIKHLKAQAQWTPPNARRHGNKQARRQSSRRRISRIRFTRKKITGNQHVAAQKESIPKDLEDMQEPDSRETRWNEDRVHYKVSRNDEANAASFSCERQIGVEQVVMERQTYHPRHFHRQWIKLKVWGLMLDAKGRCHATAQMIKSCAGSHLW